MCIGVLLVLIAINLFDERLEPETSVWLESPVAAAPVTQNAYFALISLDAQVDRPLDAAQTATHEYQDVLSRAEVSGKQTSSDEYKQVTRATLRPQNIELKEVPKCENDCYQVLRNKQEELRQLAKQYSVALDRYKTMLDIPSYAEEVVFDQNAPIANFLLARQLGLLYLTEIVESLDRGEARQAYAQWLRHQLFWERVAAGSQTTVGVVVATANIHRGQSLLSQMLALHPESKPVARSIVLPALDNEKLLHRAWAQSVVGEFHYFSASVTGLHRTGEHSGTLFDRAQLLLFKPNATLNQARAANEHALAQLGWPLDHYLPKNGVASSDFCQSSITPSLAINPVGKILVCASSPTDARRKYIGKITEAINQAVTIRMMLTAA
jgi:hypothetical protein